MCHPPVAARRRNSWSPQMQASSIDRRTFLVAASAAVAAPWTAAAAQQAPTRVRVGIIGCGSVSGQYLPHLSKTPVAEVVSACDIIPQRAKSRAEEFKIPNNYPNINAMLAGAPFDLLVNLTDMQEHEHLNRQALEAGKHVWSEKPIANSLSAGQGLLELARKKNVKLWGAPTVVNSPQFAFMARALAAGKLGRVSAAHACYGHTGPHWSAFFYEKGGGSLPDLGVYNLTTLTGLLGPAKAVSAMTSIITKRRTVENKGDIAVEAEDNAMVLMDHGGGVMSHVQCGFNYFDPHGHDATGAERATISVLGSSGAMHLVGYDWGPQGVDLQTADQPKAERLATDTQGYVWQEGATRACESLVTGKGLLITPEHALHVLEVMEAARSSQDTGRRIDLKSTFKWPVVA
jgi:predicted dehydrogenase